MLPLFFPFLHCDYCATLHLLLFFGVVRLPYEEGYFAGKHFSALKVTLGEPTAITLKQEIPLNFTFMYNSTTSDYDLLLTFPSLSLLRYNSGVCSQMRLEFMDASTHRIAWVIMFLFCHLFGHQDLDICV